MNQEKEELKEEGLVAFELKRLAEVSRLFKFIRRPEQVTGYFKH